MAQAKKEEKEEKSIFETLSAINVNEHIDKKKELSYLSWPWAWSGVKKPYPDASYKIGETDYDEQLGFMCHTTVTIKGETLEMWLPVMDSSNKSMKKVPWTYKTKYGEKIVEAATSFDINKTIMRCLVKNLAMFGLGIYIYAGEDLPEDSVVVEQTPPPEQIVLKKPSEKKINNMIEAIKSGDPDRINAVKDYLPMMVDGDDKETIKALLTPPIERQEEEKQTEIPLPPEPNYDDTDEYEGEDINDDLPF